MKVLFLTKYGFDGASSRYRVYQYIDYLRKEGFSIDVESLISNKLFSRGYRYRPLSLSEYTILAGGLLRRIYTILRQCRKYDLVFVQMDLSFFRQPILERQLRYNAKKIIFDVDDYFATKQKKARETANDSLLYLAKESDAVIAGNKNLKEFCRQFNDNVYLLPTVIDTKRFSPREHGAEEERACINIGWIGSPTNRIHLETIKDVFIELGSSKALKLKICGLERVDIRGIDIELSKWSYHSEVEFLRDIDIGIMPLADDRFGRAKCGLKLLQYMSMCKPVIASPIGANVDIVQHGKSGYFAETQEDWVRFLKELIRDDELRKAMGEEGRERVVAEFSLESKKEALVEILLDVAGRK